VQDTEVLVDYCKPSITTSDNDFVTTLSLDIPASAAGKEGKQMGVSTEPSALLPAVQDALTQVQEALLAAATAFRDENIVDVTSYDELKAAVAEGEEGQGQYMPRGGRCLGDGSCGLIRGCCLTKSPPSVGPAEQLGEGGSVRPASHIC
jgi:hypothetical protein